MTSWWHVGYSCLCIIIQLLDSYRIYCAYILHCKPYMWHFLVCGNWMNRHPPIWYHIMKEATRCIVIIIPDAPFLSHQRSCWRHSLRDVTSEWSTSDGFPPECSRDSRWRESEQLALFRARVWRVPSGGNANWFNSACSLFPRVIRTIAKRHLWRKHVGYFGQYRSTHYDTTHFPLGDTCLPHNVNRTICSSLPNMISWQNKWALEQQQ